MNVKIAHCADVHIGAECENLAKLSKLRRSEIKRTFFDMLKIIKKNDVDILLIAGDLFHDSNVYDTDVKDVKDALEKVEIQVVISPGNHDPFTMGSPYYSKWPENVYIFKNNYITSFEIKELQTRVWGSAFTDRNNSGVKINKELFKHDDFVNILVTHGTCLYDKSDLYNPINVCDIGMSGMNYIALGHIHKKTPVLHEGNTFYAYPGCLEGRSFKETGEKGFYLGTVSKESCRLDFIRASKRLYIETDIDITGIEVSEEIYFKTMDEIKKRYGEKYIDNIYKINFVGVMKEDSLIDVDYLESKLMEDIFFVRIFDDTEVCAKEDGKNLKSIFVRNMKDRIERACSEEEKYIARKALKLGLLSFSREVFQNDN